MPTFDELLATARSRGIGPTVCRRRHAAGSLGIAAPAAGAKLIDVRTNAERHWVGQVALPPGQHMAVEWTSWPERRGQPAVHRTTGAGGRQGRRAAVPVPLRRAFAPRRQAGHRPWFYQCLRHPRRLRRRQGQRGPPQESAAGALPICPGSAAERAVYLAQDAGRLVRPSRPA